MEKKASLRVCMDDWHRAIGEQDELAEAILKLIGGGNTVAIETLLGAYGKAWERATLAMTAAGYRDYEDMLVAWMSEHKQEFK
ncbi:hypothetical protein [Selenomonas sp. AB3002]|uniref:hypothetical protein n=1 Tax=Selenomonas sp. AB3002 TaxID=1392502 RepID=UPI00049568E9